MKQFIVFAGICLMGFALAQDADKDAFVRNFKTVINEDGTYEYQFDTSNGIVIQESGQGGQYAQGYAQHYAPDGGFIQLTYTADENGFHPSGDHLPTPPPIPVHILKALEYIKNHPSKESTPGNSAFFK